jgi:hypothetical protein
MKPLGVRLVDAELAYLDDLGLLVSDRDAAERLLRLIGALAALTERHGFDERGRCRLCRPARRGRRRRDCTVHEALVAYRVGHGRPGGAGHASGTK